jgi:5-(carboxyamino)imidazole ribonucleotide mutase
MIDSKFKKAIQVNTGCVVVMAGSDSDEAHIQRIVKSLEEYEIPYQVRICSAHKQPRDLIKAIAEYNRAGGSIAYVSIAGGTDALSGILSFHALGPVISCPPDAPNETCLTNPPGSSNAYIERPENVGRFIAQMFAGLNPNFQERLERTKARKLKALQNADVRLNKKFRAR